MEPTSGDTPAWLVGRGWVDACEACKTHGHAWAYISTVYGDHPSVSRTCGRCGHHDYTEGPSWPTA